MRLIVIRHADAEPSRGDDFARKLTPKGRKQSKAVGAFLARIGMETDMLLSSPLVRARETADLVQKSLCVAVSVENGTLACGMQPEEAAHMLRHECGDAGCVALVGHEPDLSTLCAWLCGMRGANFAMKKASCAIFDLEAVGEGEGELRALVPVKYLSASD